MRDRPTFGDPEFEGHIELDPLMVTELKAATLQWLVDKELSTPSQQDTFRAFAEIDSPSLPISSQPGFGD